MGTSPGGKPGYPLSHTELTINFIKRFSKDFGCKLEYDKDIVKQEHLLCVVKLFSDTDKGFAVIRIPYHMSFQLTTGTLITRLFDAYEEHALYPATHISTFGGAGS